MESCFDLEMRVCPICGKEFIPAPQHVYRYMDKVYCSWTCFRKVERGKQGRGKPVEQYTLDGEYIRTFDRAIDAANHMGVMVLDNFYKACRLGEPYKNYIWKYAEEKED